MKAVLVLLEETLATKYPKYLRMNCVIGSMGDLLPFRQAILVLFSILSW